MSKQHSRRRACAPVSSDAAKITLAAWLADQPVPPPPVALQLITRIANALGDAHLRGTKHGSVTPDQVMLSGSSPTALGDPTLIGFPPSTGAWPRREDVAADVAGLAGVARALLLPAPVMPVRGRQRPARPPARARATAAVVAAGMDRREGVFVFESPLDFVAALEAAIVADAGTPHSPDPALLAMRRRRLRRRVLKLVTGAVAALALLVVSTGTAPRRPAPAPTVARALQR